MHEEILSKKRGNTWLDEVINRVMSKKTLAAAMIIGGIVLSACGVSVETVTPKVSATETQPRVTETAPRMNETPTLKVTPTTEATPTAEVTSTPFVEEGTVREKFERGEVMTKSEIKVNVDWFYGLSDAELSSIVVGNLWSDAIYKGDSRPRDIDGNLVRESVDLGRYFTKEIRFGGDSVIFNFFNGIYLGTTTIENEGNTYYVHAIGTKDNLGNRMVVYGVTEIAGGDNTITLGVSYDRTISSFEPQSVNEKNGVENLLNNYQKEVVAFNSFQIVKWTIELPEERNIMNDVREDDEKLMSLLDEQIKGSTVESLREFIEGDLVMVDDKLKDTYTKDELIKFLFIDSVVVHKEVQK